MPLNDPPSQSHSAQKHSTTSSTSSKLNGGITAVVQPQRRQNPPQIGSTTSSMTTRTVVVGSPQNGYSNVSRSSTFVYSSPNGGGNMPSQRATANGNANPSV
jgi:hypothetical protein